MDGCRDDNIKFYHPPKTAHYIFILCLYVAAFPLCVTNFVIITHNYLFTSFIYSTWLLYFKYHVIIHTKITNSICNALFAKHTLKEFATYFQITIMSIKLLYTRCCTKFNLFSNLDNTLLFTCRFAKPLNLNNPFKRCKLNRSKQSILLYFVAK